MLPGSLSYEWLDVEKLVKVANQVYVLNILRSCAPDVFPQRQVLNSGQASQQMKISRVLILSPIPHSLPSLHLQFSHPQSSSPGRGSAQELRQQGRSETSRDNAAQQCCQHVDCEFEVERGPANVTSTTMLFIPQQKDSILL